ncbi:hypothetical protein ACSAZL_11185 [Methanosarcina sp. T3]
MKIIMGLKSVDKNLQRDNSGKMDLMKKLSEEKGSKEINQDEKAEGGIFR